MDLRRRVWIVMSLVVGVLIFDQVTKKVAEHILKESSAYYYLWDTVQFRYAENTGAWGGLGSDLPYLGRLALLLIIPSLFLVGLFFYVVTRDEFTNVDLAAFGLILGGGLGNLIDRAIYGYVIDFLYMGIGQFGPPVAAWFAENLVAVTWFDLAHLGTNIFNIADVAIMAGTIYILLIALFRREPEKIQKQPVAAATEASDTDVSSSAPVSELDSKPTT